MTAGSGQHTTEQDTTGHDTTGQNTADGGGKAGRRVSFHASAKSYDGNPRYPGGVIEYVSTVGDRSAQRWGEQVPVKKEARETRRMMNNASDDYPVCVFPRQWFH